MGVKYIAAHAHWDNRLLQSYSAVPGLFDSIAEARIAAQEHCEQTSCELTRHFVATGELLLDDTGTPTGPAVNFKYFRWNEPIESDKPPVPSEVADRASVYALRVIRSYGVGSVSGLVYGDIDETLYQALFERLNEKTMPFSDILELMAHDASNWRKCKCPTCKATRESMGYED